MKIAFCLPFLIALCFTSGCSNAQDLLPKKVLIVYLSRTNNTKAIAEIIHKQVGGTLVRLELQKPYPENYKATVGDEITATHENVFAPI